MSFQDNTVWNRSNRHECESDEDVWDDRALISAYDRAISKVNVALTKKKQSDASGSGIACALDRTSGHLKKSSLVDENKKDKVMASSGTGLDTPESENQDVEKKWHVGDDCLAVFSEDGIEYKAQITSIDTLNQTCIVQYDGYGNEEEKSLVDLKVPDSEGETHTRGLNQVGISDEEGNSLPKSVNIPNHHKSGLKKRTHFNEIPAWFSNVNKQQNTPHSHHHVPHSHTSKPTSRLTPSTSSSHPPLIPPFMPDASLPSTDEEESLASMLMSWYMSGYHTGYYKALKQSKLNCTCKH